MIFPNILPTPTFNDVSIHEQEKYKNVDSVDANRIDFHSRPAFAASAKGYERGFMLVFLHHKVTLHF
jgi:hypothetical protein